MKTLKRIIMAGTLAMALVSFGNVTTATASDVTEKQVEYPFEKYGNCVDGCVNKYEPETWGRALCAADCYLHLVRDTIRFFNPFI